MIPKVIHYCWFGRNPLPELAVKCIASWRRLMPGYEIKEWNEDNFDVNMINYTREAYDCKKYAFVSDYARFWILYRYGGIYFDTDVEVLKSIEEIVERGPYMGNEKLIDDNIKRLRVAPGLGLASAAGDPLLEGLLSQYEGRHFLKENGEMDLTTIVSITTEYLRTQGLVDVNGFQEIKGWTIYPPEYFASRYKGDQIIPRTENSYTIHHYAATWKPLKLKMKHRILDCFPRGFSTLLIKVKRGVRSLIH